MRLSELFLPTLRDDPSEAEVASHRLLLRAGYIRQVMAGVYSMLPMGLRTMHRIEEIVREEMDASGAQEIRVPIVLPAEPWKATGRWGAYGELLFTAVDRHGRELLLGPTHEEVMAQLVAAEAPSYRDLPKNLYQIEWKYRDEFRPRFGLLRGREFLMKDAYSFDRDDDGMRESYRVMYEAYERVFRRCGLEFVVVEADPGQIGGGINHEYMAIAQVGEDLFVRCESGDYLADTEAAVPGRTVPAAGEPAPLVVVDSPDSETIEKLCAVLGVTAERTMKCILFLVGDRPVCVLVPGDREVNETKVERRFFPETVRRADDGDFARLGLAKGYVGPQGLDDRFTIIADPSIATGRDWVTGANEHEKHATGVNAGRDFRIDEELDAVEIRDGDTCPTCGGKLLIGRSIVVGHIYQLGTRYSEPLGSTYVAEDGAARPIVMGSYGIGITRIVAAAVEQHHDEHGIRLPKALAPFDACVVIANRDDDAVVQAATRIHDELAARGIAVVLDDRDAAAGVKFADADLVGYPVQVVVGKRGVAAGTVDLKLRATGERSTALLPDAVAAAVALLAVAP